MITPFFTKEEPLLQAHAMRACVDSISINAVDIEPAVECICIVYVLLAAQEY
jgi:hypothetical protein